VTEPTWIYVPDQDRTNDLEGHDWTGQIWSEGDQMLRWQFEVIRRVDGYDFYDRGVFQNAAPVSVLVDHQQPATLLRPIVSKVDAGKVGIKHPFMRTKLSGTFEALLTGRAVADEDTPLFVGVGMESPTFTAWYGGRPFREQMDDRHRLTGIEIAPEDEEKVLISGLGEAVARRFNAVQRGHASSEVKTSTVLRITFEGPKSLRDALDLCLGIELVFGFLTGYRPRPPIFHLWWQSGESEIRTNDAQLEVGGVLYRSAPLPHPAERLHMAGRDSVGLYDVLENFVQKSAELPARISAIEAARWFGGTLNERFVAVMPVLEEYLKAHFRHDDEESFIALEQAFFDHIDASDNLGIREFARKHIEVKGRKTPSLTTLISRATEHLNKRGFAFQADLAKRIAKRRAAMFHTAGLKAEEDIQPFYEEATATTAILLLLTMDELGVDIEQLSSHHRGLHEFSQFMKPRKTQAQ